MRLGSRTRTQPACPMRIRARESIVSKYLNRRRESVARDEAGQMAFLMLLTFPVVFIFFALTLDAGLWFLDHRMAQNQADAAALAAVQHLPVAAEELGQATDAVKLWLTKNGSGEEDLECLEYSDDLLSDGLVDTVRVCVGRESKGIFSTLVGVKFVHVSAAAKAVVGPAYEVSNFMPWALVPPDPDCRPGQLCKADMDGNGKVGDDEYCGYFKPVPLYEELCPWGIHPEKLFVMKSSDPLVPGNFGAIAACGPGVVKYIDCIEGEIPTEFYLVEGATVKVTVQPGNLGANTYAALESRYGADGCDVPSTPHPITGMDPFGKALAWDTYVENRCNFRLVGVPILHHFPKGAREDVEVIGVATFYIASWDRKAPYGNAEGNTTQTCSQPGPGGFKCQMVWGYFMENVRPPTVLLERIGDSDNPFAPMAIALVE